ncbi:MAG: divergent polysaccharide deacetylase family protein [Methyloceanibacter sp.]
MKALAVAVGIVFWTLVLGITWLALFSGADTEEPVAVLQIEPAPEAPPPEAAKPPSDGIDFPPGFAITGPATPQESPAAPPMPPPGATLTPAPDEIGVPDLPETPGDGAPPADAMPPAADVPPTVDMPPAADAPPAMDMPPAAEIPPAVDMPPAADAPPMPDRRSEAPAGEQSNSATPEAAEPQTTTVASPEVQEDTGTVTLIPVPVAELVEESQYGPLPKIAADGRRPAEIYARPSRYTVRAGSGEPARVEVLVNGLGLPGSPSDDVLKGLPAPVSVAYGAYGRDLQDLVTKARAAGHEVLLQIPLEPNDYPSEDPGPHTLLTTLPDDENIKRLQWLMSRYTGYVGVTNHMGAKFEATKDSFLPVLEELKKRGLIYFDDGTVQSSTAAQIASVLGLDYSAANLQIDAKPSSAGIAKALAELEDMAHERGAAIGVAKAKPETVRQIAEWAGKLEAKGIVLVPVSAAVRSQRQS